MKMKTFISIIFIAVVAVVGYNLYLSQNKSNVSDLTLANIEALAATPEIDIAFCVSCDLICIGQGIEDIDGYRQY